MTDLDLEKLMARESAWEPLPGYPEFQRVTGVQIAYLRSRRRQLCAVWDILVRRRIPREWAVLLAAYSRAQRYRRLMDFKRYPDLAIEEEVAAE